MKISLSPRLLACADFVGNSRRFADIGCDHGYLSIHLLKSSTCTTCIAADVRPAPLESAKRNAKKYGVTDRITFCLCDGVREIPRDFDTLICAGMGADTMMHILSDAPWLKSSQYRLVLQCQSKTHELRKYLSENGWNIAEESVLRDGRFLYTVMEVLWQPQCPKLTLGQCYFPPAMLHNPGAETIRYYHRLCGNLRNMLLARAENANAETMQAYRELLSLQSDPNLSFLKEENA